MKKLTTALLLSLFTFSIAQAEETKQVVLKVNEMNCQLCAYLVNKAVSYTHLTLPTILLV